MLLEGGERERDLLFWEMFWAANKTNYNMTNSESDKQGNYRIARWSTRWTKGKPPIEKLTKMIKLTKPPE